MLAKDTKIETKIQFKVYKRTGLENCAALKFKSPGFEEE
jgi:hypothetical protein